MSEAIFVETKRFVDAVAIINQLSEKKVPLLAKRLVDLKPFSADEKEKLRTMFGISTENLALVLEGMSYIFETSAYHSLKPNKLLANLLQANINEAQAQALAVVWNECRDGYLTHLRGKTLGGPRVLENVNWQLQLKLGEEFMSKEKDITSILNLTLGDANDSNSTKEHISMELDEAGLMALYEKLEVIQNQLDVLAAPQ